MLGKAVVIVAVLFLFVGLITFPSSAFNTFAKPTGPGGSTTTDCGIGTPSGKVTCCYITLDKNGNLQDTYCATCVVTNAGYIDCLGANWVKQAGAAAGSPIRPPIGGNIITTPLLPGSIIKVPPGFTNALPTGGNATNPGNTTGTLPALTVSKEHNPSSPNILSLAPNATNPSNNTSAIKLSPLTGQTSGHHHHKGPSTSSSNTNSTGH